MIPLCLTPEVLHWQGQTLPEWADVRLAEPPAGVGFDPPGPPPPSGREVYGASYEGHHETEHFTIQWEGSVADQALAERTGEILEEAWEALVTEGGWPEPVSSDRYFLWVLLVDDLDGTGLTSEYFTSDFPAGYPVIFLNVAWADDRPFWRSLASHEFHHALQFGMREYASTGYESWYWEASASWASVLVEPDTRAIDYTTEWYASATSVRADSTTDSHQYGMYVFNAWLDSAGVGPGAMLDIWEASGDLPYTPWPDVMEEALDRSPEALWAGFAGAYGNGTYGSPEEWADPAMGGVDEGERGNAEWLGTRYYRADRATTVRADATEGTVVLSGAAGYDPVVAVEAGDVVAVTATSEDGARWVLAVDVPDLDPEDSGGAVDTGEGVADDVPMPERRDEPGGCGCGHGSAEGAALLGILAVARRRRA